MADMLKFYKGQLANLPEVGTSGALYITEDEGAIYLGTGSGMKRLGDFIQVADVASLPEKANESALYYCVTENVLAKWNGSGWSQINKDTGATAVTVTGDGNAVTAAEYDAVTRTVKMTKGATYATPAVVDSKIATAVGELGADGEGNAYANVKAYVDAKTEGIATDAELTNLQNRMDSAEDAIEDLQDWVGSQSVGAQIDAKITALDLANTYEVKGAAQAVQDDLDAYKGTNDTAVAAAKKAGDDAQADVDALAGKVGEPTEGKTIVEMIADAQTAATYNDTEVRGLITANTEAIDEIEKDYLKAADKTELQGNIDKKADKSVVDEIAGDYLKTADKTELEGKITAEENARKAADEALDERVTAVETFFVTAEGETLDTALDTLVEIQKYITTEGSAADQMVKDIEANEKAIEDLNAEVGNAAADGVEATGLYKVIADADKALSDRIDDIHTHENLTVLDGVTAEKVAKWDAAQANVIETVKVNGVALTPDADKAVDVTVPTGALASKDEVTKDDLADALVAEINAKAVASDVTTELAKKVDKETGKSLVADAEITKLATVSEGANKVEASTTNGKIKIDGVETTVYTHPEKHAIAEVDGLETALAAKLEADDIAGKANAADVYAKTETYTKTEVEALLAAAQSWGEF